MVSALIAVVIHSLTQGATQVNLIDNSALIGGWSGWEPVWSRENGAASASIVAGRTEQSKAALIRHSGTKDWALAQQKLLQVKPGEIYEISAWMKFEGNAGTISTVSKDAAGSTIQWEFGKVGPQKPGWQLVHRQFVVPSDCKALQFRIVGYGAGQTWIEAPSLTKTGFANSQSISPVTLKGNGMTLTIGGDGSMVAEAIRGKSWNYRSWSGDYLLRSMKAPTARIANLEVLDLADDLNISMQVQLDSLKPEVEIVFKATGPMASNLALPGSIVTEPGDWVVLPMNEGIRYPVDDTSINGWSLVTYGGHGLCMPWAGVVEPKSGSAAMAIIETPNDADVLVQQENGRLTFEPRWEPSFQAFKYERRLRLRYFAKGGFVAMAKEYRAYAKATGLFKTLTQKKVENPNIDRLVGAVNIWNWDMDKVALCREMKQMGFDRVLWSSSGSAEQVRAIAGLGYLPGKYDIFQDVWDPKHSLSWQNTQGWPEDLVLDSNGDWMKGWNHPDKHADGTITWYQGGVISSGRGLIHAKEKIPADLAQVPYLARFIDTTTASPFREDFNPLHPLTRTDDRKYKMELLDFCSKDMKLVTGSETGIDPSVPYVAYYEGMMSLGPYRLPDSGTFMMEYRKPTPDFLKYQVGPVYRIPLWELVYHDCTVAQWYWGDATNKAPEVWDQRDLLNILYGTSPLLMFDKNQWQRDKQRMLQTYRNVCEWVRKIGYDEMVSHEDLTSDHTVQRTTWSSGRSVIVNFGDKPFGAVKPMSFALFDKR